MKSDLQGVFVKRVAEEMSSRGISANTLAKMAKAKHHKIGQTTISLILRGKLDPSLEKVFAISEALGLPAWFLMTDTAHVEQRVITTPKAHPAEKVVPLGSYQSVLPVKKVHTHTGHKKTTLRNK